MAKAKKTVKNKSETKPAQSTGAAPLIDPAQVAAAAAAMVAHKVTANPRAASEAPRTDSSAFRQLKDAMNKPHAQTMGGLLDKMTPSGSKKSAVPFGASRQVGHNQTFGADVNRKLVPRRTGG